MTKDYLFYLTVVTTLSAVLFHVVYADTSSSQQAQAPDQCEMGVGAQNKNCSGGMDKSQSYYKTDVSCAQKRIGKPTYTAELTSFNDSNCTWGACNNSVAGIAHRVWPPKSKVEVCNLKNGRCAVAIVMDRGPNVCLVKRTIDANPALQQALNMVGQTVPATYKLLSAPGVSETSQPSGITQASADAIIAANNAQNQFGTGAANMTYSTVDTPYGPGYLGTPSTLASSPFSSVNPLSSQPSTLTQAPVSSYAPTSYPTTYTQQPLASSQNITSSFAATPVSSSLTSSSSTNYSSGESGDLSSGASAVSSLMSQYGSSAQTDALDSGSGSSTIELLQQMANGDELSTTSPSSLAFYATTSPAFANADQQSLQTGGHVSGYDNQTFTSNDMNSSANSTVSSGVVSTFTSTMRSILSTLAALLQSLLAKLTT